MDNGTVAEQPRMIRAPLKQDEIAELAADPFGDMLKFVVDLGRGIAVVGGDFHSDGEAMLIEDGAAQEDLWGGNYYPGRPPGSRVEYSALINIRPAQGQRGHLIASEAIRAAVRAVVERLVGPA